MSTASISQPSDVGSRVAGYGWSAIAEHLDAHGWAVLPGLLTTEETAALANLYGDEGLFRSHVIMARHGFGRGEYKYFSTHFRKR